MSYLIILLPNYKAEALPINEFHIYCTLLGYSHKYFSYATLSIVVAPFHYWTWHRVVCSSILDWSKLSKIFYFSIFSYCNSIVNILVFPQRNILAINGYTRSPFIVSEILRNTSVSRCII